MKGERIAIAADHGGFGLKEDIKGFLKEDGYDCIDMGTDSEESVDYPDYGVKIAYAILNGEVNRGILICGTGIGMSIAVNRFKGIRGALCHDVYTARMSREHNDSNVLVLGGRVIGKGLAMEIVRTWIKSEFAGGRHQRRLDKIEEIKG